jgi:hypothetical protein
MEHVARMVAGKIRLEFWYGNVKERGHLGGLGIDGTIIIIVNPK